MKRKTLGIVLLILLILGPIVIINAPENWKKLSLVLIILPLILCFGSFFLPS